MSYLVSTGDTYIFFYTLACTDSSGYSSPGIVLDISIGWTSEGSCKLTYPTCQGPFKWHHTHVVYQPLIAVLFYVQICCGCSFSLSQSCRKTLNVLVPVLNPGVCHYGLTCALCCCSQLSEPGILVAFHPVRINF